MFSASAAASPNVELDDHAYDELARLRALGAVPAYDGGFLPLTERRVGRLLGVDLFTREGAWFEPVARLSVTTTLFRDSARPYSTPARPRDLAGELSVACERTEGRPCGDGAVGFGELTSNAGYRDWVSGSVRLRLEAGSQLETRVALDRAYITSELGPVAIEVGRDVIALGPSRRAQLGWGTNAAPITHVRVSTSEPFRLTSALHANAVYLVGRMRSPQTFPGNLVAIGRGQLDIGNSVELGVLQLLQLGGDGARSLDAWEFIAEHFRRGDPSATATDSSNRRFGGDISVRISQLAGARFYYSLVFEDIRKHLVDALHYDADHLVGVELAALGPHRRHGLTVEWQKTGARSQEHNPRLTGFTNMGRVVGNPLGPDSKSFFAGGRIELGVATLYPWLEYATADSDVYVFVINGPIYAKTRGPAESRYRAGARIRVPLQYGLDVEGAILAEHVSAFAFDPREARNNLGLAVSLVWQPRSGLRLSSE